MGRGASSPAPSTPHAALSSPVCVCSTASGQGRRRVPSHGHPQAPRGTQPSPLAKFVRLCRRDPRAGLGARSRRQPAGCWVSASPSPTNSLTLLGPGRSCTQVPFWGRAAEGHRPVGLALHVAGLSEAPHIWDPDSCLGRALGVQADALRDGGKPVVPRGGIRSSPPWPVCVHRSLQRPRLRRERAQGSARAGTRKERVGSSDPAPRPRGIRAGVPCRGRLPAPPQESQLPWPARPLLSVAVPYVRDACCVAGVAVALRVLLWELGRARAFATAPPGPGCDVRALRPCSPSPADPRRRAWGPLPAWGWRARRCPGGPPGGTSLTGSPVTAGPGSWRLADPSGADRADRVPCHTQPGKQMRRTERIGEQTEKLWSS